MTQFLYPGAFALLLLLLPMTWSHWRSLRGGKASLLHPIGFALRERGLWIHHLHFALKVAAFTLLVTALARPQKPLAGEEVLSDGVDIMLALDTSGSMDSRDFLPRNRLEVAKRVASDFISGRPGDRIGLVIFAARAITRCPLTVDHDILLQLLDDTRLGILPDGTAIGNALATSISRLKVSPARSRVVVLVTDGVNNTGEVDPATASRMAQALGIRIYSVGVGREGSAPMPVVNPYTGQTVLVDMEVRIDEELLRDLSHRTGGEYFRATDSEGLRTVFSRIDAMEKTRIKVRHWSDFEERYQPFLKAGLILLLVWMVLSLTLLRRLP